MLLGLDLRRYFKGECCVCKRSKRDIVLVAKDALDKDGYMYDGCICSTCAKAAQAELDKGTQNFIDWLEKRDLCYSD